MKTMRQHQAGEPQVTARVSAGRRLVVAALLLGALAACGRRGKLRLPTPEEEAAAAEEEPAAEKPAEEGKRSE